MPVSSLYHEYLARGKPLQHYFHHYLLATVALFFSFLAYGSITPWEAALFYFATFIPLLDDFSYAVLNYVEGNDCRAVINLFLVGDVLRFLHALHDGRRFFLRLLLHNVFTFIGFWGIWYICLVYEIPIGYYFLSGILAHLFFDVLNDKYEFNSVRRWFWPLFLN